MVTEKGLSDLCHKHVNSLTGHCYIGDMLCADKGPRICIDNFCGYYAMETTMVDLLKTIHLYALLTVHIGDFRGKVDNKVTKRGP